MSRLNFLLVVAAVLCALLLITSQHKARKLFNELELEQDRTKQLGVEWGQLQLEQSTWASPSRVEKLARERLHMVTPDPRRTVVVPVHGLTSPAATPNAAAEQSAGATK
jgi:cell division protein FtsL